MHLIYCYIIHYFVVYVLLWLLDILPGLEQKESVRVMKP